MKSGFCLPTAVVIVWTLQLGSCRDVNRKVIGHGVANPPDRGLELYDLAESRTDCYPSEVHWNDRLYFRSARPALDLSWIDRDTLCVFEDNEGDFGVAFDVKEDHMGHCEAWTRACIGRYIAISVDGEIRRVDECVAPIRKSWAIVKLGTRESLEQTIRRMKAQPSG